MKFLLSSIVLALFASSVSLLAADTQAGKTVYNAKCKVCHGADGNGNPALGKTLKVEFKPLGSKEVQTKTGDEIKKQITQGGGKMKGVSGLSDKQIQDVVAFLRSFAKS